MANFIAVTNQKGGVGKTTTAVNLAAAIGLAGKKTLLVDVDPQGNSTSGLGIDRREIKCSAYDVLLGTVTAAEAVQTTAFTKLSLLPGSMDLAAAELELIEFEHRESVLKQALEPIASQYAYIIIDCPPSLGLITTNAICAADTILVPIQCEFYALEGLSQLMNTVRRIKQQYNPKLELEGVLLTMFDGRLNLTQQVVEEVKKYFPKKIFSSVIPRTVRLSEAPSYGKPIQYYDPHSKGAEAYNKLAKEVLKHHR